jgi:Uma2 family endonuclease
MTRVSSRYDHVSFDEFEAMIAEMPEDEKWELLGGKVVRMMVGARWEHKRIVMNVTLALAADFERRGSDCFPYDETFWLKTKQLDLACFPDVMVKCGPLPPGATSLDDPVVLIEVVSKSSKKRDRIDKLGLYQRLPSLQHYALIEVDKVAVDVLDRLEGRFAPRPRLSGLGDLLQLPAVAFEMPLGAVYRGVIAA